MADADQRGAAQGGGALRRARRPGKSLRFGLAIGLILIAAAPANAARWSHVTQAASGAEVSIDLETLDLRDGWARVRVRHDFSHVASERARYLLLVEEINCNAKALRIVASVFFAPDGRELSRDEQPSEMKPVVPGSVNEGVGKAVCAIGVAQTRRLTPPPAPPQEPRP